MNRISMLKEVKSVGNRPRIESFIPDTLCNHCDFAKDRVNNRYVTGCYCVNYGYIVSRQIERCKGYRHRKEVEKRHDGNES